MGLLADALLAPVLAWAAWGLGRLIHDNHRTSKGE